jgi:hypothetical protein
MGVDFYACQNCGDTYPDCGYYFTCTGCESNFCSDKCGKKISLDEESEYAKTLTSCVFCRYEEVTDRQVLLFLCKKYNIVEEDAIKECIEDLKNG